MDNDTNQQQSELLNLIQFAFCEKKYKKVIELVEEAQRIYPELKDIYLFKAKAYAQLNKVEQCVNVLENEAFLDTNSKQILFLKIRSYIELGKVKEAEKSMQKLLDEYEELKKTIQLRQALNVVKDNFKNHVLSQQEQKILQSMKIWLQKAGASYPKLKIVNLYPGYRGVIASRHIKKKEQIVYVPKSQLITLQMAKANKYSKALIENRVRLQSPKHTFLSILLLEIKSNQNSKFKPYIDLLPQDHTCFPINFAKQQLEMLQGSPFLNMVFEKVIDLKKDYEAVVKTDISFQKYSFKQFCWARMMIGSRIFGLTISGIKTEVLVPFADMLNHRHPKQTIWNYEELMNGFVIESLQDIQVGQQVFDSYGRKCNSRFLLNYGFVIQDNLDNQIALKLIIDKNESLAASKLEMIKENINENYVIIKKINLNFNNNKFYELMGCLRFICVQQKQTIELMKKISNIAVTKQPYIMMRTPPLFIKNELLVWKRLSNICKRQLEGYPDTLQLDRQLLKKRNLTYNQRNILILRMGEKAILDELTKICAQVIQILSSQNIIQGLKANINKMYARYLYKILCVTPGINKKQLQKALGHHFTTQSEEIIVQQTEQVAEH